MKRSRVVLDMAWISLYAALFIVLDYISNQVPFFKMPNGGTIGFSTIILLLASYHLGWKKGVLVALITIPLQGFFAPYYSIHIFGFILEYIVAFAVYGFASIFPSIYIKVEIMTGVIVVNVIRFLIHLIAGVYFWEVTWWGSLIYNAWYMIPTMIVGLIFTPLIYKRIKLITHQS
jgi:thiamine transporter